MACKTAIPSGRLVFLRISGGEYALEEHLMQYAESDIVFLKGLFIDLNFWALFLIA